MNMVISRKQLTYSVGAFIFGASLLTSNLYYFAENDSWVSVLIGLVVSLMIVGLYTVMANRYPGLGLTQINKAVFGKTLGKIVSGLYAYYFLSLAYFNTRNLGDFLNGVALPETPKVLIFIIFIMVCAWAVRKGPSNIARYGFLAVFIAFAAIVFNGLLLINRTHLEFLQPALTLPLRDYLIGAHIVTMLPFCEIIAFMTFIPYLRAPEAFGSAMRRGLLIGAAVLMLIVLRDITVLGPFTAIFAQPTFFRYPVYRHWRYLNTPGNHLCRYSNEPVIFQGQCCVLRNSQYAQRYCRF